jgi:CBS domain containing-hemolysin-like protein
MVVRLSDHEARVDGRADVDEILELFDLDLQLEDAEEYDTVGGLVYHRIGGVPSPGDAVEVGGLRLTVESTDGRRVGKVLVTRLLEPQEPAEGDGETPARRPAQPRKAAGAKSRR